MNPLDKNGKISRCVICDSKMHWAGKCPHRSNNQSVDIIGEENFDLETDNEVEEANIVLITEEIDKNEIFVAEACKLAVIDTACTKTVVGE